MLSEYFTNSCIYFTECRDVLDHFGRTLFHYNIQKKQIWELPQKFSVFCHKDKSLLA